ncbi:cytohesin-1-like isoform X2, partial [Leptotrombidium deliense]
VYVREVRDRSKSQSFELYSAIGQHKFIKTCNIDAHGRVIEGRHTVYRISAAIQEDKDIWIKCI